MDLSRSSDLSDVRLDATRPVCAIALAAECDRLLAAYADGTIREWDLTPGRRPDDYVLFWKPGLSVSRLGTAAGGVPWALLRRRLLLFDTAEIGPDASTMMTEPAGTADEAWRWRCIQRIPAA